MGQKDDQSTLTMMIYGLQPLYKRASDEPWSKDHDPLPKFGAVSIFIDGFCMNLYRFLSS